MGSKNKCIIGTCGLCKNENVSLRLSHIIPKFVTRKIIKNSVTGYMRNVFNPDQRLQDGDKQYLLCGECEERLNKVETKFANQIFHPYKNNSKQSFKYEDWLNYFIISVNWRNLYLDLSGFEKDKSISSKQLKALINREEIMRDFLMKRRNDLDKIENHMFFFDDLEKASKPIAESRPHSFIRHSSFGYSLISHDYDGYYVVSNLGGILIFTLLKKSNIDKWDKTKIENEGIYNIGNQYIKSPIASDVFSYMEECREKESEISQRQHEKIVNDLVKNRDKIADSDIYKNKKIDTKLLDKQ